jgi:hypothetical protein
MIGDTKDVLVNGQYLGFVLDLGINGWEANAQVGGVLGDFEKFDKAVAAIVETRGAQLPTPGMGATLSVGSDEYPVTITRVSESGKTVWFRKDRVYGGKLFTPNPDNPERRASLRKDGVYREHAKCGTLAIGTRGCYSDPSF